MMGVTSDVCEPYKSLCMTPVDEVSLVVWMSFVVRDTLHLSMGTHDNSTGALALSRSALTGSSSGREDKKG